MAIWLNDTAPYSPTHQNQYFMDGDSTPQDLPGFDEGVGKGSVALHISTGKILILQSDGIWMEFGAFGNATISPVDDSGSGDSGQK